MAVADAQNLTAKEAIKVAREYFNDFFQGSVVNNILLEEIEFEDGLWSVPIGFDVGRTKMRQPSGNALAAIRPSEVVPVREARTFVIRDKDSALVKMFDV